MCIRDSLKVVPQVGLGLARGLFQVIYMAFFISHGRDVYKRQIERKRPMKFLYEAILTPWSGGWEAEFPDLGICTQGDTLFDAAFMAQDLLTLWISQALREGRPLPEPRMDHPAPANGKAIAVAVECDADTPSLTTMTVQEAADILDVSTSRIHAMIRDGILRTEKVGSARLVSADDVIDYFNSPRTAGRPKKVATA